VSCTWERAHRAVQPAAGRSAAGRFLLRIEDTDTERSLDSYTTALMADLPLARIDWDAGPDREDEPRPYRQSQRGALYRAAVSRCLNGRNAVYPCFCHARWNWNCRAARSSPRGKPPRLRRHLPRSCPPPSAARREKQGLAATLRFRVPRGERVTFVDFGTAAGLPQRRHRRFRGAARDGSAAFFFSNAVDDACMG